jgi:anthranilate synthase component 1
MNNKTIRTIYKEITADLDTPISVYLKVKNENPSFLLESVEGGDKIARYSFIGINPVAQYILFDDHIQIHKDGLRSIKTLLPGEDPTVFLHNQIGGTSVERVEGLPRFIGGLVGYMGFDMIKFFEPSLQKDIKPSAAPLAHYLLTDTIIAFDHARRSVFVITHLLDGNEETANARIEDVLRKINTPLIIPPAKLIPSEKPIANMMQADFEEKVITAKENIKAGDIFQVVLSQQFSKVSTADPFDVYRTSRRLNPSPYMYFFDLGQALDRPYFIVGSSPEMFVRLENNIASLRPIAGTRQRGQTPLEDQQLMADLIADPKENAEHVMLVDLGRNDLGRVCQFGSVNVTDFAIVEKYSHVMHLVSNVEGQLKPGLNAFDLVRSAFPAGTVSGAPKIRAMEIISALEQNHRGAYGGMVGYFGFDGAMDTCLTIRTLVVEGNRFTVQAGAGIVADSVPQAEYQETINKASAMLKAIELTESLM